MPNDLVVRDTGEITRDRGEIDIAASVSLMRAEIDMQIATARTYPRSVAKAVKRIIELATLDEETAEACCYVLTRRKKGKREQDDEDKPIEGPSIRLAEIAANCWGNARTDARVITVNRQEMYVEAEATFHDLETNMGWRKVARRNIRTSGGRIYSEDMINVTGMAACAIAQRNAILAGIPQGVVMQGYNAARKVMIGDLTTLSANRAKVYAAFAKLGIAPDKIHEFLGVVGESDITLDHIALLRATFASIKNGEATVAEVFGKEKPEGIADPLGTTTTNSGRGANPPAAPSRTDAGEVTPVASPAKEERPTQASTESAGGQSRVDEPKAETASAKQAPAPTTPGEYRAHVLAYVASATSASALEAKWRAKDIDPKGGPDGKGDGLGDRSLRRYLNIESALFDELEAAVKARCAELRGTAT